MMFAPLISHRGHAVASKGKVSQTMLPITFGLTEPASFTANHHAGGPSIRQATGKQVATFDRCSTGGGATTPSCFQRLRERKERPVGTLSQNFHDQNDCRFDFRAIFVGSKSTVDPAPTALEEEDADDLSIGSIDLSGIAPTWEHPSFLPSSGSTTTTDDKNSWAYRPVNREIFL
jgi:hypothetical protein